MSTALKEQVSKVWGCLAATRVRLYESGFFRQTRVACPVISIGNLSVGGTGKTPVTLAVADFFNRLGKQAVVISRNYRAQVSEPARVDAQKADGAAFFGDEPFLLASRLPNPVFVGPNKKQTAQWAISQLGSCPLILIDDGFQHRGLGRDLDVVLIDATDTRAFKPLPAGTGREGPGAMERADWILLTKINWASTEQKEFVRSRLPVGKPVTEVVFQTRWPDFNDVGVLGVFAGIARPEIFFDLAKKKYFGRVAKTWAFQDHQVYGRRETDELRAFLRAHPDAWLVTTEKDAVKIQDPELRARMKFAAIQVEFSNAETFFERLRSVVL